MRHLAYKAIRTTNRKFVHVFYNASLGLLCFCFCILNSLLLTFCFLADEREAVQKKTFTKWVNSHLGRVTCRIGDLYTDLRDGRMLIRLLEVLSGEQLVSIGKLFLSFSLS